MYLLGYYLVRNRLINIFLLIGFQIFIQFTASHQLLLKMNLVIVFCQSLDGKVVDKLLN